MKKIMILMLAGMSLSSVKAQTWTIDNAHSQVMFTVNHLVISEVTGNFKSFNGNINSVKTDFSDATVEFIIEVNSINTDNEMRDNHLKGDDFFNAAKYPRISFKGQGLQKVNGNNYKLNGELTIRDVTKPVTLDVVYFGMVKDPWGNNKAGFRIKTSLNRFDYNLKWDNLTEAGGAVVGKDVDITINMELAKAQGN